MAMRRPGVLMIGVALIVVGCSRLGGCSRAPAPAEVPVAAVVEVAVAPTETYDLNTLLAAADTEQGRMLFTACSACHSLEPGVSGGNGPNLYGVFSRRAGQGAFQYSDAFRQADFAWTPEQLDRWLRNPRDFIQGSRMNFLAIDSPQDRAHLIAYLMRQTDAPTVFQPAAAGGGAP